MHLNEVGHEKCNELNFRKPEKTTLFLKVVTKIRKYENTKILHQENSEPERVDANSV
jgi:hypothetical protein